MKRALGALCPPAHQHPNIRMHARMQAAVDKALKEGAQSNDRLTRLQREMEEVNTHNATIKADNAALQNTIRQQVCPSPLPPNFRLLL